MRNHQSFLFLMKERIEKDIDIKILKKNFRVLENIRKLKRSEII